MAILQLPGTWFLWLLITASRETIPASGAQPAPKRSMPLPPPAQQTRSPRSSCCPFRVQFHFSTRWQKRGHMLRSAAGEAGNFRPYCCIRETYPIEFLYGKMNGYEHDGCPQHLLEGTGKLPPPRKEITRRWKSSWRNWDVWPIKEKAWVTIVSVFK